MVGQLLKEGHEIFPNDLVLGFNINAHSPTNGSIHEATHRCTQLYKVNIG